MTIDIQLHPQDVEIDVEISPATIEIDVELQNTLGMGIPADGLIGEFLRKTSNDSYATQWQKQDYSSYIYNPDLDQQGPIYNDWQDLVQTINDRDNPPTVINFTKLGQQTLPAGHYDLNNVTWRGPGTPPGQGPVLMLPDGFTLEPQTNWQLEYGVTLYSDSLSPVMTIPFGSQFRLDLTTSGIASQFCEMLLLQGGSGTLNIIFVADGASLAGENEYGYEVIRVDGDGAIIPMILAGINASIYPNSIRGGTNCPLIRFLNTIQQVTDPFPAQDNWDGFIIDKRGMPTLIGFDPTGTTLTSNNVQDALVELHNMIVP